MDWDTLFCEVDDFCQEFEPLWRSRQLANGERKRCRDLRLSRSEIMTILIAFHSSQIRTFKHYYCKLLTRHRAEFPHLTSYSRFAELMPSVLTPLSLQSVDNSLQLKRL